MRSSNLAVAFPGFSSCSPGLSLGCEMRLVRFPCLCFVCNLVIVVDLFSHSMYNFCRVHFTWSWCGFCLCSLLFLLTVIDHLLLCGFWLICLAVFFFSLLFFLSSYSVASS